MRIVCVEAIKDDEMVTGMHLHFYDYLNELEFGARLDVRFSEIPASLPAPPQPVKPVEGAPDVAAAPKPEGNPPADGAEPKPVPVPVQQQQDDVVDNATVDTLRAMDRNFDPNRALEVVTTNNGNPPAADTQPVDSPDNPDNPAPTDVGNNIGFRVDSSGDLIWNQVSNYLTRDGQRPSDAEIYSTLEQLAATNGVSVSDLNNVNVGDSFAIADSDKFEQVARQMAANNDALTQRFDTDSSSVVWAPERTVSERLNNWAENPEAFNTTVSQISNQEDLGALQTFVDGLPDGPTKDGYVAKLNERRGEIGEAAPTDTEDEGAETLSPRDQAITDALSTFNDGPGDARLQVMHHDGGTVDMSLDEVTPQRIVEELGENPSHEQIDAFVNRFTSRGAILPGILGGANSNETQALRDKLRDSLLGAYGLSNSQTPVVQDGQESVEGESASRDDIISEALRDFGNGPGDARLQVDHHDGGTVDMSLDEVTPQRIVEELGENPSREQIDAFVGRFTSRGAILPRIMGGANSNETQELRDKLRDNLLRAYGLSNSQTPVVQDGQEPVEGQSVSRDQVIDEALRNFENGPGVGRFQAFKEGGGTVDMRLDEVNAQRIAEELGANPTKEKIEQFVNRFTSRGRVLPHIMGGADSDETNAMRTELKETLMRAYGISE